jgi:hypothetical protein
VDENNALALDSGNRNIAVRLDVLYDVIMKCPQQAQKKLSKEYVDKIIPSR